MSGSTFSANGTGYTVISSLAGLQGIDSALAGNYVLGSNIDATETSTWGGGGFAGYLTASSNAATSSITNSYATGDVTGVNYVGGLAGYSGAYIGTGSENAGIIFYDGGHITLHKDAWTNAVTTATGRPDISSARLRPTTKHERNSRTYWSSFI